MNNPLTDVLPAQARRVLYAIAFFAALVFALWQASEGNWAEFVGSLLSSLVPLLAASNTPAPELEGAHRGGR
jgi:hypothetical protein